MMDREGEHVEDHRGRRHRHDLLVGETHVARPCELLRSERRGGIHVSPVDGLELTIELLERGTDRALRCLVSMRAALEMSLKDAPDDVDVTERSQDQVGPFCDANESTDRRAAKSCRLAHAV